MFLFLGLLPVPSLCSALTVYRQESEVRGWEELVQWEPLFSPIFPGQDSACVGSIGREGAWAASGSGDSVMGHSVLSQLFSSFCVSYSSCR